MKRMHTTWWLPCHFRDQAARNVALLRECNTAQSWSKNRRWKECTQHDDYHATSMMKQEMWHCWENETLLNPRAKLWDEKSAYNMLMIMCCFHDQARDVKLLRIWDIAKSWSKTMRWKECTQNDNDHHAASMIKKEMCNCWENVTVLKPEAKLGDEIPEPERIKDPPPPRPGRVQHSARALQKKKKTNSSTKKKPTRFHPSVFARWSAPMQPSARRDAECTELDLLP